MGEVASPGARVADRSEGDVGRPRETAPEGFMLPREAAEVLGVSEESVKNWIRSKRLAGREWLTPKGEKRYHAEAEAVRVEAAARGEVARAETVREVGKEVALNSERLAEAIMDEFRRQGEKVGGELLNNREERRLQHQELLEILTALRKEFAQTRRELREAAEREQRHQERVLRLMEGFGRDVRQNRDQGNL